MSNSDEAEIVSLIQKRSDAAVQGDLELLDTVLADDFIYINKRGDVVTRASYFKQKRKHDPDSYWIAQTIDETQVTVIDRLTALVFRVEDHQMFEGNEMRDFVRTSYVCRKIHGQWKLLFGQTSPVVPDDD